MFFKSKTFVDLNQDRKTKQKCKYYQPLVFRCPKVLTMICQVITVGILQTGYYSWDIPDRIFQLEYHSFDYTVGLTQVFQVLVASLSWEKDNHLTSDK